MSVTMRQMLEAGVHFGHQTRFWNPKMAPYIFGQRNKIHIINLEKTLPLYQDAMKFVAPARRQPRHDPVRRHQAPGARDRRARKRSAAGMPYVDQRWLGGMLTNFKTVKQSIKRLKEMEAHGAGRHARAHVKKEALGITARAGQARAHLGGIKDMTPARRALRHRRRLPEDRRRRGEEARHPGDRRGRHQPLARRHRLRDPGQRRLEPRHPPVRARHRRRGARRPHASRSRKWSPPRATSSSRWKRTRATK